MTFAFFRFYVSLWKSVLMAFCIYSLGLGSGHLMFIVLYLFFCGLVMNIYVKCKLHDRLVRP